MPLFNESLESIAQAIVTVKRALEEGVIEEENYKGLNDYLAKRAKDFKIKKSHLARANKNLDDELEAEVEEFFMDEGDALCGWAEEFLQEHEKDDVKDDVKVELTADEKALEYIVADEQFRVRLAAEIGLSADEKANCDAWLDEVNAVVKAEQAVVMAEQKAQKAWAKMQGAVEVGLTADQKAQKAWRKMDDEERAAMAKLVSECKR
jgi:hypothetical protein